MVESAWANLIAFCNLGLEIQYLQPLIDGVAIDLFHVVQVRLRHIYSREPGYVGECLDIVVASSAEVDDTASVACEKSAVVGSGKFLVELGGEIHCAVVTDKNFSTEI